MKKVISVLLTLMMFCMSGLAFADDAATTTDTADYLNTIFTDIITIDFFDSVLVTTNNDRWFIDPK